MSSLDLSSDFCPQSLQRSAWHRSAPTSKLVRMPWCSVPPLTTRPWTSPLSGPWTAATSTCTPRASTTSEERWEMNLNHLTERQKHTNSLWLATSAATFRLWPGVAPHRVITEVWCSGWSGHFWGWVILGYFGWNTWNGKVQPVRNDWPQKPFDIPSLSGILHCTFV